MLRYFSLGISLGLACFALGQQRVEPLPPPAQDNPRLVEMDRTASDLLRTGKYSELTKAAPTQRAEVAKMLDADEIGTAQDFIRASSLFDDSQGWFEVRRSQHEFAVMALALGSEQADEALRRTWDFLMISMGERQRFGFIKSDPKHDSEGKYLPDLAPLSVRRVFDDPQAAKERADGAADNLEIRRMREEDQAARIGTVDLEKLHVMADADRKRQKRVAELLAAAVPRTPHDFEALALIMQHGGDFEDYRLAHELMMAAVLVGYRSRSLLAATYDRMMLSAGHRQRFGTQWWQSGLAPLDASMVNDRMRHQFGIPKLEELRSREQEILKRLFGGG